MLTPQAGRLRLARAVVVAGTTLSLSLGAHLIAGGSAPAAPVLVLVAMFMLLTCVALAGRGFTPVRLLAVLGLGQVALHGVFSWLGTTACAVVPAAPASGLGHAATHAHHQPDVALDLSTCLAPGTPSPAGSAPVESLAHAAHLGSGAPATVTMVAAHVVVTLLVAALVARGERALWRAAEVLVVCVRGTRLSAVPLVLPAPDLATVMAGSPVLTPQPRHHLAVAPRRGPPRDRLTLAA
ncbi:hypothetical protein SAMN05216410_0777 [Sanguibacter gelidistatuariae]|uniref:Uncharacterized protein n=1 Tax=Sanguibacter gelidistatuariae TaxID=1814289 RepID=A0A1G6H6J9_9MICO|nr:hypothetical protein [Sanguibacter gelidistatuariae]SDB89773.1 hypothetical protein SAMN05216410_0777 [Sanguibacter gelidistatuariae]